MGSALVDNLAALATLVGIGFLISWVIGFKTRTKQRVLYGWLGLGCLMAGLVMMSIAMSKGVPAAPVVEEIRAQRFLLVDEEGRDKALLAANPDGGAFLSFLDAAGEMPFILGIGWDGSPGLRLIDADGKMRLVLAMVPDGSAGLELYDAEGNVLWQAPPR